MTQLPPPSLPKSLDEMLARMKMGHRTDEGKNRAMAFKPRPTDIIISPFAKSGTTWLQQMVHTLRTRGSMEFEEITAVVPWLESAYDLGLDIEGEQVARPRAYKSHMNWYDMPKGGRYIYSIRDPKDVLVSFYHFFENWQFEAGTVTLEEFAGAFFTGEYEEHGYWHHVISWWEQRDNPAILFLSYEEMKADLRGTIERVANFIGIELDDDLRDIAIRQSGIDFMKAHAYQFDDKLMRRYINPIRNLPLDADSSKVRSGNVGEHKHKLSPELAAKLDDIWDKTIRAKFGYETYADLRAEIVANQR